jgi:hypothetical protein
MNRTALVASRRGERDFGDDQQRDTALPTLRAVASASAGAVRAACQSGAG